MFKRTESKESMWTATAGRSTSPMQMIRPPVRAPMAHHLSRRFCPHMGSPLTFTRKQVWRSRTAVQAISDVLSTPSSRCSPLRSSWGSSTTCTVKTKGATTKRRRSAKVERGCSRATIRPLHLMTWPEQMKQKRNCAKSLSFCANQISSCDSAHEFQKVFSSLVRPAQVKHYSLKQCRVGKCPIFLNRRL